jgi:hypothetical protein
MSRAELGFDRVVILERGERRSLSVDQFLEMPLDARIHLVLSRAIEFYRGALPVDRRLALAQLRQLAAVAGSRTAGG